MVKRQGYVYRNSLNLGLIDPLNTSFPLYSTFDERDSCEDFPFYASQCVHLATLSFNSVVFRVDMPLMHNLIRYLSGAMAPSVAPLGTDAQPVLDASLVSEHDTVCKRIVHLRNLSVFCTIMYVCLCA